MGMSLSNQIFYGFKIGDAEDEDLPLCVRNPELDDEFTYHDTNEKLLEEFEVEIITANYHDDMVFYLAFKESVKSSYELTPIEGVEDLFESLNGRKEDMDRAILEACNKIGIPVVGQSHQWFITSSYW